MRFHRNDPAVLHTAIALLAYLPISLLTTSVKASEIQMCGRVFWMFKKSIITEEIRVHRYKKNITYRIHSMYPDHIGLHGVSWSYQSKPLRSYKIEPRSWGNKRSYLVHVIRVTKALLFFDSFVNCTGESKWEPKNKRELLLLMLDGLYTSHTIYERYQLFIKYFERAGQISSVNYINLRQYTTYVMMEIWKLKRNRSKKKKKLRLSNNFIFKCCLKGIWPVVFEQCNRKIFEVDHFLIT